MNNIDKPDIPDKPTNEELTLCPIPFERTAENAHNTEAEWFESGKRVQLSHDKTTLALFPKPPDDIGELADMSFDQSEFRISMLGDLSFTSRGIAKLSAYINKQREEAYHKGVMSAKKMFDEFNEYANKKIKEAREQALKEVSYKLENILCADDEYVNDVEFLQTQLQYCVNKCRKGEIPED
jgi:hypothetical protein